MFIGTVTDFNEEVYLAVCRFVPQLGSHKSIPTQEELTFLIESQASTLLIARYPEEGAEIAGMLTIMIYRVPTGVRSIVEDVVVDKSMRGHGIARALLSEAIEIAKRAGAEGVALTSNSKRVSANLLYQNMGFETRKTNAYFYKLK